MFVKFATQVIWNHSELGVPAAWLVGAKTALSKVRHLKTSEEWVQFFSEIETLVNWWDDIEPVDPERALLDKSLQGSIYDYIGGYVSVAGRLTSNGINLRINNECCDILQLLLPGLIIMENDDFLIPLETIPGILNLVTIIGPLLDAITEVLP